MKDYNEDEKLIIEDIPLEVFQLIKALLDSTKDNEKKPMSKT